MIHLTDDQKDEVARSLVTLFATLAKNQAVMHLVDCGLDKDGEVDREELQALERTIKNTAFAAVRQLL